ncbi:penicillin-binding protein activator [Streptosporangium jomthongense]|uniref:Penicillin-binding protein activator n=1 Tax=Marinobacter aromaticivorans TaxID=1494078 RepID=A0ABW2IVB0_9GAMM|nr:penicillin-binding protein activator [Marinobacter aromaticivorans]GGE67121.1 penicillin-binding protein activator [Streptosporangium jomthongense]
MTKNPVNHRVLAGLFTLTLLFAGCASVDLDPNVAQSPSQALELAAKESNTETAQQYLLRIASRFQDRGDHRAARTLLQSTQLAQPAPSLKAQKQLLTMASAVALEDREWASAIASDLSPENFRDYSPDLVHRAANLQSDTYALAGDRLSAAITLMLLAQTDSKVNPQQIHDQIWALLKAVPDQQLTAAGESTIGFESEGWLELAASIRAPGLSIDDQGRIVRRWQSNWPSHPAAQVLPSELQLIANLAANRPEKIALAVPLKGPLASAGKAIRDGFLAAYYQDDSTDRSKTDIRIIDTSDRAFDTLYKELANQDTDLVIGPLDKEALARLASIQRLPVPALGLNYLPENQQAPEGLYQFGLSAEDEARQIADRLSQQNINQVLALIPQGEWGDRVEAALVERMQSNGAVILDIERFFREDNLRAVTADLLGITVSRDRAIQVERTIGLNVEFEPRRRQDAQAIVMVAEPAVARQFKPLFAFYFGGDLPVYSPSIIYEGTPDAARDRDLNQVIFTDIPWVLNDKNPLREQASKVLPGTRGQLGRLFAMGADAWQLSKRLPLLRQVRGASVDGQTGELIMTPAGSIHRTQLWAQFKNGTPTLLPQPEPGSREEDISPQALTN